jgi:hypothetical protein
MSWKILWKRGGLGVKYHGSAPSRSSDRHLLVLRWVMTEDIRKEFSKVEMNMIFAHVVYQCINRCVDATLDVLVNSGRKVIRYLCLGVRQNWVKKTLQLIKANNRLMWTCCGTLSREERRGPSSPYSLILREVLLTYSLGWFDTNTVRTIFWGSMCACITIGDSWVGHENCERMAGEML